MNFIDIKNDSITAKPRYTQAQQQHGFDKWLLVDIHCLAIGVDICVDAVTANNIESRRFIRLLVLSYMHTSHTYTNEPLGQSPMYYLSPLSTIRIAFDSEIHLLLDNL